MVKRKISVPPGHQATYNRTVKEIITVFILHMFNRLTCVLMLRILTIPKCSMEYGSLIHVHTTPQHLHAVTVEFNLQWADIIFNIQDYLP
jgi:hypothetical protein